MGGFDFVEPLEGPAGDLEAILPRKYTAPEGIGAVRIVFFLYFFMNLFVLARNAPTLR